MPIEWTSTRAHLPHQISARHRRSPAAFELGARNALAAFLTAGLDVLVRGDWVLTREDNAHVATGAALVRRDGPEEELRRSAQSGAVGSTASRSKLAATHAASTQVTPLISGTRTLGSGGDADHAGSMRGA